MAARAAVESIANGLRRLRAWKRLLRVFLVAVWEAVKFAAGWPIGRLRAWIRPLNVLLVYAWDDDGEVEMLRQRLARERLPLRITSQRKAWGYGLQRWLRRIVPSIHVMVVCLSTRSVTGSRPPRPKPELELSLEEFDLQPADRIRLIPLKLEPCVVPPSLRSYPVVNLFQAQGYSELLRVLRECLHRPRAVSWRRVAAIVTFVGTIMSIAGWVGFNGDDLPRLWGHLERYWPSEAQPTSTIPMVVSPGPQATPPTPTPTPTTAATSTPTATPATPTMTPSPTAMASPTPTATPSPTASTTPTDLPTPPTSTPPGAEFVLSGGPVERTPIEYRGRVTVDLQGAPPKEVFSDRSRPGHFIAKYGDVLVITVTGEAGECPYIGPLYLIRRSDDYSKELISGRFPPEGECRADTTEITIDPSGFEPVERT